MYDVVVVTRDLTFSAFGLPAEDVRSYVEDSLAAWGVPFPRSLEPEKFVATLTEHGSYHHQDHDVDVTVTRQP